MTWFDSHLHFFALQQGDYDWLKPNNPPFWPDKPRIACNTTERHLMTQSQGKVDGFVHIEAGYNNRLPWREIEYLDRHCSLPFKAVACIDLTDPQACSTVDNLLRWRSVTGLRHILDDEATTLLTTPRVKHCLAHISHRQLSFDAQLDLTDSKAVTALLNVISALPQLKVMINHTGASFLAARSAKKKHLWLRHIQLLSECPGVAMKMSGWEMASRDWRWQEVARVCDALFERVPYHQLMFASNFPLCGWRLPYLALWQGYEKLVAQLPKKVQRGLLHENATQWYRLNDK